jgi:hypothetical protein
MHTPGFSQPRSNPVAIRHADRGQCAEPSHLKERIGVAVLSNSAPVTTENANIGAADLAAVHRPSVSGDLPDETSVNA